MMNQFGAALVAAVLFFACGKPSVIFSNEKMMDSGFDSYKTYAFLPTTDTLYAKMIDRKQLVTAMVKEARAVIEKKGMVLDTTNPDCLFTYHLVINRKYDANQQTFTGYNAQTYNPATIPTYQTSNSAISGGTYMRTSTDPYANVAYYSSDNRPYTYAGNIQIDTLREGSMVIDMIDAKTRKVVWRSLAKGTKYESEKLSPEKAASALIPVMLKKMPRK
jgi:hypothetical protein